MTVQTQSPQTYGVWQDETAVSGAYACMELNAAHLSEHWRRNSLSSDFWAYYAAQSVETAVPDGLLPKNIVQDILSYLLNELFENCAKFSSGPNLDICYQSWIQKESMVIQVTNHIQPDKQAAFVEIIEEILTGDVDELYFQKLEDNAENDFEGSGLGYLTLIKDYGIQFGFRFRPQNSTNTAVDVQAHVSMKEN
ncbi:MAG: hypothetical protein DWQ04_25890 [Chloroflexi bacterium]|nr:MAG: hypothetical protein DWQ04_25890 [Chloroflexota bacterium]